MATASIKMRLHRIIFGTEPGAGRNFDILLIVIILSSVGALFVDSVENIHQKYGDFLFAAEVFFTILFTLEYAARIYCSPDRRAYIFSFYGIVDLLATIPTYLSIFLPGAQHLLVIRIFRVLRVFRVFKLFNYMSEANVLIRSLISSRRKISVFLISVLTLIVVFGALMYLIEGPKSGFTSLPRSMYWAIVTVTTVGYGDIAPRTPLGQLVAAMAMITSYAIIAIPTGILSAELIQESQRAITNRQCDNCKKFGHEKESKYCRHCGEKLSPPS
ncbi:Cyclic nucleotide-gated potassium channel [Zhongshania aliphaticivorans]|uniref:Cyclic nucleotide-gated potassium channel n=1 Tax=Zhongshania aliphaticivorans TaxID=1470434 RepID=A0A5S9QNZ5_9GAMM|nr:ion transporter [Zhongshania aliphaticivorans]CAA0087666.1 Cyclic nucleotide-gated potassium channel [Zhongshania aliphaticivorans]CAA0115290.1 Cyclic nucleotide-gated potassium channel [Zhongshania aliphaticivorans]CAA0120128.1 Cyclic nucleotide-gated potassium channel [Zhongshania aliphaticivorans]